MNEVFQPYEGDAIISNEEPSLPLVLPSQGAGFWIRALARIIDTILLLIIGFIVGILIGVIMGIIIGITLGIAGVPPESIEKAIEDFLQRSGGLTLVNYALSILATIVYYSVCESLHGSTLGKLICGLVVVTEKGTPCGIGSALGRSAAFLLDALFFGIIAAVSMSSSPKRQRLGDKWFHTVVAKRRDLQPEQLRSAWRFVIVLMGAVALNAIILFISQLINFVG
jgi:uncharacterized RDD family membrane protein YckC